MSMVTKLGTFPDIYISPGTGVNAIMDATGERLGSVFMVFTAGNIAKIHCYFGIVTTGDTLKVSLQTVDADTGLPTGTVWPTATGNKAYGTVAISAAGWQTVTFTEAAPVAFGNVVAIVYEWDSYGSGNIRTYQIGSIASRTNYSVYGLTDVAASPGTWTKSFTYINLSCCLEYDDGNAYLNNPFFAHGGLSAESISSSTTPDEVGNYFQVPVKMEVSGFYYYGDFDYELTLQLMNSSDTVLANATHVPGIRAGASHGLHEIYFDTNPASSYTLLTGTWYRITMVPGASAITTYAATVASAAMMGALDGGTNFYATTRSDGGAWTNTNTKRYYIGLLVSKLDDGVSTGGGAPRFGDMTGGLK